MRPAPHLQFVRPIIRGPSLFFVALLFNFTAWAILIAVIAWAYQGAPRI